MTPGGGVGKFLPILMHGFGSTYACHIICCKCHTLLVWLTTQSMKRKIKTLRSKTLMEQTKWEYKQQWKQQGVGKSFLSAAKQIDEMNNNWYF